MKRLGKKLLKVTAYVLPVLLLIGWLSFWSLMELVIERQSASAEILLTHISGNVYLIDAELNGRQLGASLAASVGPDGVLLVDTPMTTQLAKKVRQALDDLGAGPVRVVANTHPHPDHTRSNAFFAQAATVIAHTETRTRLAAETRPFRWLPTVPPLPPEALPTETFDASHSLQFNGEEIRLLHLGAGHTDGDVVVYFTDSNVVHVGDLFNGRGGRSVSDRHNAGGDIEGLVRSLDELRIQLPPDVRILCGHGGLGQVSTLGDLSDYLELLRAVVAQVQVQIAAGQSLEDVVAAGVGPRWTGWFESAREDSVMHGAADGWLKNLYLGLSSE